MVDDDPAIAVDHEHLCLTGLPLGVAVEPVGDILGLLDLLESSLGLLEGEVPELNFWVDDLVAEVVLVDPFAVFGEDVEVVEVGVAVEAEGHLVQTQLQHRGRRQLRHLLLLDLHLVHVLLLVVLRLKYLLHVQLPPQQQVLGQDTLLDLRPTRRPALPVLLLVLDEVGDHLDRYLFEGHVDLTVDVLQVGLHQQVMLLVFVEQGVDDPVLRADVHRQVVQLDDLLRCDLLLGLDALQHLGKEKFVDLGLDLPILSLTATQKRFVGGGHLRVAPGVVEVVVQVGLGFLRNGLSELGVKGRDVHTVSQGLGLDLLLQLQYLGVDLKQTLAEDHFFELLFRDFVGLAFAGLLLGVEEGVEVGHVERFGGEALGLAVLDEADEGGVDDEGADADLELLLAGVGEVEAEDLDELDLAFGLELAHEGHDQVLELADDVAADLLLALEDLDEVVEVLVDADGEAGFLVDLALALLLAVDLLEDGTQVDLLGQFLLYVVVAGLIREGQVGRQHVLVIRVVDVEVLLSLLGVDRVQLEEVLPPLRPRAEPPCTQPNQSQHLTQLYIIYQLDPPAHSCAPTTPYQYYPRQSRALARVICTQTGIVIQQHQCICSRQRSGRCCGRRTGAKSIATCSGVPRGRVWRGT